MKTTILFFDRLMQKWTPDPYIIAIFLTLIVITLAKIFTPASNSDIILSWGDGIWKLSTFTLQMAMILVGGYLVASAPLINQFLKKICSSVHSPLGAIVITTFISGFASWLNWGFGLVVGAFLAIEMARAVPHTNFRILVASSYSGFLLWHGGLSGSIPLVVNTEGNFSFEWIGRIIPLSETIFSPFNLIAVIGLLFILPLTNLLLAKILSSQVETTNLFDLTENHHSFENTKLNTPAEKIEHSPVVSLAFFVLGAS
ncbi:MAG: short-chain fatty acid transporter, partial [Bdellovibrionales bacterium]|nr:short-chain fatty acid transporter [Bdellovibrionales bacterium]